MAIKKSELYSSLWASCDKLRGSMEPSQYKAFARYKTLTETEIKQLVVEAK